MSLAYGTPVNTSSEVKSIEAFRVGDYVLSASSLDNGTIAKMPKLNRHQVVVAFSESTGANVHQPTMCYVRFGDEGQLICNGDHLFLMPSGKLKRADRLIGGHRQGNKSARRRGGSK